MSISNYANSQVKNIFFHVNVSNNHWNIFSLRNTLKQSKIWGTYSLKK